MVKSFNSSTFSDDDYYREIQPKSILEIVAKFFKNSLMPIQSSSSSLPRIQRPISHSDNGKSTSPEEEVKLAALAISLNIRLRSADMPFKMQQHALHYARTLLHTTPHRPNPSLLARSLKKEFDTMYGPAWHCVVEKSFGSFVTHSPGGFVYFSLESLSFLLFKTEVQLITESATPAAR